MVASLEIEQEGLFLVDERDPVLRWLTSTRSSPSQASVRARSPGKTSMPESRHALRVRIPQEIRDGHAADGPRCDYQRPWTPAPAKSFWWSRTRTARGIYRRPLTGVVTAREVTIDARMHNEASVPRRDAVRPRAFSGVTCSLAALSHRGLLARFPVLVGHRRAEFSSAITSWHSPCTRSPQRTTAPR
jgi:hypothetical protein